MPPRKEIIKNHIQAYLEKVEKIGQNGAGSGHLAFKFLEIDSLSHPVSFSRDNIMGFRIEVHYRILIETEFTFYPDNPPQEYRYSKALFCDKNGKVLGEIYEAY